VRGVPGPAEPLWLHTCCV